MIKLLPIGTRFGKLATSGRPFHIKPKVLGVVCKCECGNVVVPLIGSLRSRHTKSCGCMKRRFGNKDRETHGLSRSRLYSVWASFIKRCTKPSHKQYPDYGGRGITVCDEWLKFEPFGMWAIANGYREGLQIDRIDNNSGYRPDNCRWTTRKVNSRNRRNARFETAFGETKVVAEWAEDPRCAVSKSTLQQRFRMGWNPERAITMPSERVLRKIPTTILFSRKEA